MIKNLPLFLTAILQVALVSMNVVFISNSQIIPMLVTGWGISFVWTLNVKKTALGSWRERFVYATGAMIGTGIGYLLSNLMIKIL